MPRTVSLGTLPIVGSSGNADTNWLIERVVNFSNPNHTNGDGVSVDGSNIEIYAEDTWGGMTLSSIDSKIGSISYMNPLAASFGLQIVFKVGHNKKRYYQLRDKFTNIWCQGLICINLHTGNYFGGDQWVNGYISPISFDEIRSDSVTAHATFNPTSPWHHRYRGEGKQVPISQLTTSTGTITKSNGYLLLNTTYLSAFSVGNVGDEGFIIHSANPELPMENDVMNIKPSNFPRKPDFYHIFDNVIYGVTTEGGKNYSDGSVKLPDALTSISFPPNAIASSVSFLEKYDVNASWD